MLWDAQLSHLCMGGHTGKQLIYLRQRRGRNTHPEKCAGVLLNEEGKKIIASSSICHLYQAVPPGPCSPQPNILLHFAQLTLSRALPNKHVHLLAEMDSTAGGHWEIHSAYYGRAAPLFCDPQGTFLHMCSQGCLLDPKNDRCGHLISCSSRAQLLPWTFSLKYPGKTNLQCTQFDKF